MPARRSVLSMSHRRAMRAQREPQHDASFSSIDSACHRHTAAATTRTRSICQSGSSITVCTALAIRSNAYTLHSVDSMTPRRADRTTLCVRRPFMAAARLPRRHAVAVSPITISVHTEA